MKSRQLFGLLLKSAVVSLLVSGLFSGCQPEVPDIDFNRYLSEVTPEGKTVRFFRSASTIADSLFPTLVFPSGCVQQKAVVQLHYTQVSANNLPPELSSAAEANYLWFFSLDQPLTKSVTISLPFAHTTDASMLAGYENRFQLYRIRRGTLT